MRNAADATDDCYSSFGVDSEKQCTDEVMRAFFEPTERWTVYFDDDVTYTPFGPESRHFFFGKAEEQTQGTDGGVIELKVFRAYGREVAEPTVEEFREQEKYGIS